MKSTYKLTHRLIALILLFSLFLQSCGNAFNRLNPSVEEFSDGTPSSSKQLEITRQLVEKKLTSVGWEVTKFSGEPNSLTVQAIERHGTFTSKPYEFFVKIASDIDLEQVSCLSPKEQGRFVHLNSPRLGQLNRVLVYKEGLSGGMMKGNENVNQELHQQLRERADNGDPEAQLQLGKEKYKLWERETDKHKKDQYRKEARFWLRLVVTNKKGENYKDEASVLLEQLGFSTKGSGQKREKSRSFCLEDWLDLINNEREKDPKKGTKSDDEIDNDPKSPEDLKRSICLSKEKEAKLLNDCQELIKKCTNISECINNEDMGAQEAINSGYKSPEKFVFISNDAVVTNRVSKVSLPFDVRALGTILDSEVQQDLLNLPYLAPLPNHFLPCIPPGYNFFRIKGQLVLLKPVGSAEYLFDLDTYRHQGKFGGYGFAVHKLLSQVYWNTNVSPIQKGKRKTSYGGYSNRDFKNTTSNYSDTRGHGIPYMDSMDGSDKQRKTINSDTNPRNYTPEKSNAPKGSRLGQNLRKDELEGRVRKNKGRAMEINSYGNNAENVRAGLKVPTIKHMVRKIGNELEYSKFDMFINYNEEYENLTGREIWNKYSQDIASIPQPPVISEEEQELSLPIMMSGYAFMGAKPYRHISFTRYQPGQIILAPPGKKFGLNTDLLILRIAKFRKGKHEGKYGYEGLGVMKVNYCTGIFKPKDYVYTVAYGELAEQTYLKGLEKDLAIIGEALINLVKLFEEIRDGIERLKKAKFFEFDESNKSRKEIVGDRNLLAIHITDNFLKLKESFLAIQQDILSFKQLKEGLFARVIEHIADMNEEKTVEFFGTFVNELLKLDREYLKPIYKKLYSCLYYTETLRNAAQQTTPLSDNATPSIAAYDATVFARTLGYSRTKEFVEESLNSGSDSEESDIEDVGDKSQDNDHHGP